ncbi:hypothetical protein [Cerasicoccus arenae]|uniref:Uncharacterized protein n=1 Tax=Cerasicoccus arenae TaxID=424488 RepID=A0A8J3GDI4_9BACT|nr:hypothetical protein [Cerasicoccus arenae]MBK1857024.1 hypothetical protein [Cerasicoccus arenae]GHB91925.1 hypothetical protein GCM10007047_03560 [Cerasicoccus arenae]
MNFFQELFFRIKDTLADIGAYLRFGLKNQIKSVFAWIDDQFYMLKLWKEALPNARRTRQHERKEALNKLKDQLLEIPQKLLHFLWDLITSPKRAFRQMKGAWTYVSSMSLKSILAGIWGSYIAILLAIIDIFEGLFNRWLAMRMLTRILTILVLLVGIGFLISSRWVIDEAKQWRSDQLVQEAQTLEDQDYEVKAYEKLRSAALLNPTNTSVLERTMETARSLETAEAVWWSEQMTKQKQFDAPSMAKVIDYAVDYHQVPTGAKYLARLQAQHPDSQQVIDTELKLLLAQGHRNRALTRAREMYAKGMETPLVHDIIIGLANNDDPAIAEQSKQHHRDNLMRMDDIGLYLCEIALSQSIAENQGDNAFDYLAILEHLRKHPDSNREHITLAVGRAYEAGQLGREEALRSILEEYDLKDSDERKSVFGVLNFFHIGDVSDILITENDLRRDRDLCRHLLYSLIMSDSPDIERAKELVDINTKNSALNESDKHFWKSFIHLYEGNNEGYTLEMLQAIDESDVSDWGEIEFLVKTYTSPHQQLVFYRELYGLTNSNPYTIRKYVELLYALGLSDELKTILKHVNLDQFKGDPDSMSLIIYLKLQFGLDLEKCRYYSEQFIEEFPEIYYCYITLAFAYFQSGHEKMAQAVLKSLPMQYQPEVLSSHHRLAYAAVTGDLSYLPDISTAILPNEKALFLEGKK